MAAVALLLVGAAAAGAAARDLQVQHADCSGVTVTASGMPANEQLFLLVRNLANGGRGRRQADPGQVQRRRPRHARL